MQLGVQILDEHCRYLGNYELSRKASRYNKKNGE